MPKEPVNTLQELNRRLQDAVEDSEKLLKRSQFLLKPKQNNDRRRQ